MVLGRKRLAIDGEVRWVAGGMLDHHMRNPRAARDRPTQPRHRMQASDDCSSLRTRTATDHHNTLAAVCARDRWGAIVREAPCVCRGLASARARPSWLARRVGFVVPPATALRVCAVEAPGAVVAGTSRQGARHGDAVGRPRRGRSSPWACVARRARVSPSVCLLSGRSARARGGLRVPEVSARPASAQRPVERVGVFARDGRPCGRVAGTVPAAARPTARRAARRDPRLYFVRPGGRGDRPRTARVRAALACGCFPRRRAYKLA